MEEKYPLADWLTDEITDADAAKVMAEDDFEIYSKIKKYSSELQISDFDDSKMLATILASKKKQETKVVPMYRNWIYKVAALLVIGIGLSFLYQNSLSDKQIAAYGKTTRFSLPDASQVVLQSGSEIEYHTSDWDRKITLDGEAYFKVAKGKRFEVCTDLGKVAVLGTEFDVKSREKRLDVTCFEGRVQVNYNNIQIVLTQGQKVIFENGKQINSITTMNKPTWLENQISFEKETVYQVIAEIERAYDIKIKDNFFTANGEFTGKIPSDNLDIALEIIAKTYQLKMTKVDSKNIIFEKR